MDVATPDRRAWEFYEPAPEGTYTAGWLSNNLLALEHDDHRRVCRLVSDRLHAESDRSNGEPDRRGRHRNCRTPARPQRNGRPHGRSSPTRSRIQSSAGSRAYRAAGGDEVRFTPSGPGDHRPMRCPSPRRRWHVRVEEAMVELSAWVREMALERQQRPQDDLISDLVSTHDMGDEMTHDEIVTLVAGLVERGQRDHRPRRARRRHQPAAEPVRVRAGQGGPLARPIRRARDHPARHGRARRPAPLRDAGLRTAGEGDQEGPDAHAELRRGQPRSPTCSSTPTSSTSHVTTRTCSCSASVLHYCLGIHLAKAELARQRRRRMRLLADGCGHLR